MSKDPFEAAQQIYGDRYGTSERQRTRLFWLVLMLAVLNVVCVAVIGSMALRSRVTPFVVQVDRHGYEVLVGPAEEAKASDDRIVMAHLRRFVRNHRSRYASREHQEAMIVQVMSTVAAGSAAEAKSLEFYRELADEPRESGRARVCDVKAVLPLAENTWQVDFVESDYVEGRVRGVSEFRAVIEVAIEPTRRMEDVLRNPLGIYVVDFHVTEVV